MPGRRLAKIGSNTINNIDTDWTSFKFHTLYYTEKCEFINDAAWNEISLYI